MLFRSEKIMEVPEGTKIGSSVWFSSPTPRHRYTHGISEQDRCPVWAHLCVRARAHAHARWPARQGVWRGLGLWLESVQAPGLPEASQTRCTSVTGSSDVCSSDLTGHLSCSLIPWEYLCLGVGLLNHTLLPILVPSGTSIIFSIDRKSVV